MLKFLKQKKEMDFIKIDFSIYSFSEKLINLIIEEMLRITKIKYSKEWIIKSEFMYSTYYRLIFTLKNKWIKWNSLI